MDWLSGWAHRKRLKVPYTKIDDNLTDFPVLVKLTSANFDFSKALSNGYDIRFTLDDSTTLLSYERERHDSANQKAEYHVKIPSVSSTADTYFYMYYGNSSADDGANPTDVWDSHFKLVSHMKDDPDSSHVKDSTANANNGTKSDANGTAEADGKIAKAQNFDGSDGYIDYGNDASLSITEDLTYELWINIPSYPTKWENIGCKFVSDKENELNLRMQTSDEAQFYFGNGSSFGILEWSPGDVLPLNTWTYITGVRKSKDYLKLYFNALEKYSKNIYIDAISTDADFIVGYEPGQDSTQHQYFEGLIDEVRLSDIVRSPAWIKASYNSGNDSLVSYGSEETSTSDVTITADPIVTAISQYGSFLNAWPSEPIDLTVTANANYITGLVLGNKSINITLNQRAILSQWPAHGRDPALDTTFDCSGTDRLGNPNQGVIIAGVSPKGDWLNKSLSHEPIIIYLSQRGYLISGLGINLDPIIIGVDLKHPDIVFNFPTANWVWWSKIGYLDFTIDESNVANRRPMSWPGFVCKIIKLDNQPIVYGEGGVTALIPSGVAYGAKDIYNVGIKGKSAATGNEHEHYFIDVNGKLFRLSSKGLEELGYSEYLNQLVNPVMFLDETRNLLYISDESQGFIYNTRHQSLCSGISGLTGICHKTGNKYVVSPSTISISGFEICTDIYDMGTRKMKNIHSVEVATNLTEHLELQIDYRIKNNGDFGTTPWFLVNPGGIAYSPCYGVEFRFRIRSFIAEQFKLDRLKINGSIHGFSYRDYLAATRQDL